MSEEMAHNAANNHLETLFDPGTFSDKIEGRLTSIAKLSRRDLQQTLCEAMEALEQLEGHGQDAIAVLSKWRRCQLTAEDLEEASQDEPKSSIWGGEVPPDIDEDGVSSQKPVVFAIAGWQWEERGQRYKIADLSKADLQQAVCQCMTAIGAFERRLEGMTQLIRDWRRGTLRPAHFFDFSEGGKTVFSELHTQEDFESAGRNMKNALGLLFPQLKAEGVRVFVLQLDGEPRLALSVKPEGFTDHIVGPCNRRPTPEEMSTVQAFLDEQGIENRYSPYTLY